MEESPFHAEFVDTSSEHGTHIAIDLTKKPAKERNLVRLSYESDPDGAHWLDMSPAVARSVGEFLMEASQFAESET
jgi:hypothetical protein